MAADGSNAPKPYTQHRAATVFLRVPSADWAAVKNGIKTEFRASPSAGSGLKFAVTPTPVVAWSRDSTGYDERLMVLEEKFQEPLEAISPESLEREGFKTYAEFKRYWCLRERRRYMPLLKVTAYRIRPWQPEDREVFADKLLERLYGAFLPSKDPAKAIA